MIYKCTVWLYNHRYIVTDEGVFILYKLLSLDNQVVLLKHGDELTDHIENERGGYLRLDTAPLSYIYDKKVSVHDLDRSIQKLILVELL
jgi:hypothetical protein